MNNPLTPLQNAIDALNVLEGRMALAGASGITIIFDDTQAAELRRTVAAAPDLLTAQKCLARAVCDADRRAQALASAELPDTFNPRTGTAPSRDEERERRVAELLAPLLDVAQIIGTAEDHAYERRAFNLGSVHAGWDPEWPDDTYNGPDEEGFWMEPCLEG
ncbi:hypothetical protein [Deinococcus marmoris]|uniref:hypothetical protein n=1 Tax=Deinococcus marmoris TaxID=249408 RepID=UPI0004959E15|nr:hypothetical protein [Deinococcus marmoris]